MGDEKEFWAEIHTPERIEKEIDKVIQQPVVHKKDHTGINMEDYLDSNE